MAEILANLNNLYAGKQYDDIICYFEILLEHPHNENRRLFTATANSSEQQHSLAIHEYHAWVIFAKSLYKRKQYARALRAYRTCLVLIDSLSANTKLSPKNYKRIKLTERTTTKLGPPTQNNTKDYITPNENGLKYKIHLCLRELLRPFEAIAILESIDTPDRGPEVFQALAELYAQEQNTQLASLNYRELIRRSPLSLNAIKQLCRLKDEEGLSCDNIARLIPAHLVERKALHDWLPDWIRANYYLHSANSRDAKKYWNKVHQRFSRSPAIQAGLAQSLYQNGEYQAAISNFRLAYKLDDLFVTHIDSYAACLARELEVNELELLSTKMVEKCDAEGDYLFEPWIVLGYQHTLQKEPKPFHFVQRAQKINRFSVEAAILHAKLLCQRRDYSKALSQATLALSQAPYRFEVHKIICEVHVAENRKPTAVKFAQAQIKQFGETARSLHLYAKTVLSGTDNRSKKSARKYLEKAIESDPSYQPAVFAFAKLLIDEKNYDKAIEILENALESHSTNAAMHEVLAECYMEKGEHDKALDHHNFAAKLDITIKAKSECPAPKFNNMHDIDSNLDIEANDVPESEASETDVMSD